MISITTKKKVIYIDQSFISNFAKAEARELDSYKKLSGLLQKAVEDEKAVCPSSWFQREESSLANRTLERDLKRQLGYLGQVDFKSESTIEYRQFRMAAQKYLKVGYKDMSWKDIFQDDPDKHLERFKIDANLNMSVFDIPHKRQNTKTTIENIRKEILERGEDFKTRLTLEQVAYKKHLSINYSSIFSDVFQSNQGQYLGFLNSNELTEIPKFNIYSTMWSSILTGSNSREIQEGDWLDVQAISTYLPYSYIFTTDSFMKHHIIQNALDKKYDTKIFSPSKEGLESFCEEIEGIIKNNKPANIPVLSIVLIPDKKMKENYWNVCQKLNNSRNRYGGHLNRDWIELINVDDGKCPRYYHKGAKVELDPPYFMGFDSKIPFVKNKKITQEKAINAAKSNRVLIYDHYRQPDQDFVQFIMSGIESGVEKPLGYNLLKK